jgi:hypothetical protein
MIYKAISHVTLPHVCLLFPAPTLLILINRMLFFREILVISFIYWAQLSSFHLNTEQIGVSET